jgi:hypothetical protein
MLDFAPQGVCDLVQQIAITEDLEDMRRIVAINKAFNMDVVHTRELLRPVEVQPEQGENQEVIPKAPTVKKRRVTT